jgi:hypothetical protein
MNQWEYVWRDTYYREVDRTSDYVQVVRYGHFWKPNLEDEATFPSQEGMDTLGARGWELVTITSSFVSLVTELSPQGNTGYASFPTHRLFFKRLNQPA